jgi:hypothetical protein
MKITNIKLVEGAGEMFLDVMTNLGWVVDNELVVPEFGTIKREHFEPCVEGLETVGVLLGMYDDWELYTSFSVQEWLEMFEHLVA